jgi:SAM-dependent methyltransferase
MDSPEAPRDEAIARNLASWELRTPIHLRSEEYRRGLDTLRAGGTTLLPPSDTEIGDVAGKRLLHLQCHIGLDTLSLARMGADVTGLDFSPAALQAAEAFADELDLPARFVCADAQQADQALAGERFDIVFASFGVLCWIPDVTRWMQSAANLLAPGGTLYVADGHPFMDVFEDDDGKPHGIGIRYSYFRREPVRFGAGPTYADDGSRTAVGETIEYVHPLGELVTAAAFAGLRIEYVHEFPECFFRRCRAMQPDATGRWDFPPPLKGKLPMVFSLRAVRA